ncbi:hypothetical protein [Stutzerimonas stutzeri]|uniref:hypothetical protein n=1 Tax=Stutzerimonas stutzeri TaxID=316 RepID=UPI0002F518FC|nr:hypothetical protein [Stutzerimonas stutzeri]
MTSKITTQLVIDGKNTGASKAIKEVEGQLGGLSSTAKKAGAALAAAISVGAISSWVKASIDAADANRKSAQSAGLAVEEYTALQYAAKLAGVEAGSLNSAMARLNRTIAEAAVGGNNQEAAFSRLGIAVRDSAGNLKTGDVILAEIADRFKELPDGVQKSAIAMELFGRSGTQLIPLLNGGADGLADLRKEAEALGLVMSDTQAAQAEVFNDNLTRLGEASGGAANRVAGELLPSLVDLSDLLVDLNKDAGATTIVADLLGGAVKVLASAVLIAGNGFGSLGRLIGAAAAAAVSASRGEFAQAAEIMRQVSRDNAKEQALMIERVKGLWSGAGEEAARAAVELKKQQRQLEIISKGTVDALEADQKRLTKAIKDRIREVSAAENAANRDLEKLKADRLKIEQRYQEAIAGMNAGGESSYGAAQALKVGAREALRAGDVEGAQAKAQAALKMLQDLQAAGANTYGFAGFIGELRDIELAANDIEKGRAEEKIKAIKDEMTQLKKAADQLKDMPVSVKMDEAALAAVRAQLDELANREIIVKVGAQYDFSQPYTLQDPGPEPQKYATGGYISGPGTGTSDSIPAYLSNGEYVINAAAVRKLGRRHLDMLNSGIPIPRFADGGMVGTVASMQPSALSGLENWGKATLVDGGNQLEVILPRDSFEALLSRTARKHGRTHS